MPGEWWLMSVDPWDDDLRQEDEEYYVSVVSVDFTKEVPSFLVQDLEEAVDPETLSVDRQIFNAFV